MEVVKKRNPPWADLPQELLSTIAKCLDSDPILTLTFRSVCSSWRYSCNRLTQDSLLCPPLPLKVPSLAIGLQRFYASQSPFSFLSVTVVYALCRPVGHSVLTPSKWVLFLDEFSGGKFSFRKPFMRRSYSTPVNFPDCANLVDFSAREFGRFYSLSYEYSRDDQGFSLTKPRYSCEDVDKVVLCPDGSVVIALHDEGKLEMHEVGSSVDKGWETIHDGKGFRVDDIVEFKGRVLGVDRRGRVYEIVYQSSKMNPVVPPIGGGGGRRKRLVESLGSLYLVVRCNFDPDKRNKTKVSEEGKKTKFKVYELDEDKKKWVEISSIGDRCFFFGIDFSFSASAQELGTSGNNCILFKEESFRCYGRGKDDCAMFRNLKSSDLRVGACHLNNPIHFDVIKSYPAYTDSLWPPPPWIWSVDRSKRLGVLETTLDGILNRIPEKFKTNEKEQAMEVAGECRKDFWGKRVQEVVTEVSCLKENVISFQESEKKLKWLEQKLQEVPRKQLMEMDQRLQAALSEHACSDSTTLNQMMRHLLRVHHDLLFLHEEWVTSTERSAESRLASILIDLSHIA